MANADGCKDDLKPKSELEKLPPVTQEGKHTFGCLVNGKAWVTETSTDSWAFYQEGVLSINAKLLNNYFDQGIYIYDKNLAAQEYLVSSHVDQFSNIAGLGDDSAKCSFETTSGHTGVVSITHIDQGYGKWIISGTFEFEAYSRDCQKIVKVTEGRFDLTYAP